MKDFILKDHFYEFQQDNMNPDGTSNMIRTKKWGRFNQCFISSSVMAFNQCLFRLREKGINTTSGFKTSYMDELTYKTTLLHNLNENGNVDRDNNRRYFWVEHQKLLNTLTQSSFVDKIPGEWVFYKHGGNYQLIIEVLKSNYQPLVGINIRHHHGSGEGHVTTAVGWREDSKANVLGLFFNDPAGNLIKKNSYRNASPTDGKEVFYPIDEVKIFLNNGHIMYFKQYEE